MADPNNITVAEVMLPQLLKIDAAISELIPHEWKIAISEVRAFVDKFLPPYLYIMLQPELREIGLRIPDVLDFESYAALQAALSDAKTAMEFLHPKHRVGIQSAMHELQTLVDEFGAEYVLETRPDFLNLLRARLGLREALKRVMRSIEEVDSASRDAELIKRSWPRLK
jgi:hypothetical protein